MHRRAGPPREWRSLLSLRGTRVVEEGAQESHTLGGALLRMKLHADRAPRSHGSGKPLALVLRPRRDYAGVDRTADVAVGVVGHLQRVGGEEWIAGHRLH